jgi:hypothetical protein
MSAAPGFERVEAGGQGFDLRGFVVVPVFSAAIAFA